MGVSGKHDDIFGGPFLRCAGKKYYGRFGQCSGRPGPSLDKDVDINLLAVGTAMFHITSLILG